ncbi:DUF4252 domain-containing protein [Chryseobacterium sp. JUb7]|uniref:DUF4252 domain-containing protein n=1 Tax=Chryseobacterium sp. JUb7 TaxID=2940599 RepID=UPI0021699EFA|nr:DUF4252 domain-containing protein [Chryseobacterium sp. JUb7]MCS3530761.1 hypothetical protein [Chryseobacterium sp. JUb7]
MKKIIIIFALAFSHFFNAYGQDKLDQLFEKYQEVEGVTSIKIAKPMFGMLNNLDLGDAELDQIKPLLAKINGLKVLIAEKSADGKSAKGQKLAQINKDISSYLKTLNYNEIMTMNSNGAKIKFLSAEASKDGILDDLLLSIDSGGEENILVKLDGRLSMDDVNKIISSSETKINSATNTKNNLTSGDNTSYLSGESRNVGEFSGIQVSTGVIVNFNQESPTSVKVIADADKLQYIVTKVENGVLNVYIDNKGQKKLKFKNISVNVSSPRMDNIKTSSGAIFNCISDIREKNIKVDLSSGSVVNGSLNADNAEVALSSGAVINSEINSKDIIIKGSSGAAANLTGKANMGSIDVSSGAVCNAEGLKFTNLKAESTSGAVTSAHASEMLKATASSGGTIKYKGNPKIDANISKTSGGTLKPIN